MAYRAIPNLLHLRRAWTWDRRRCERSQFRLLRHIVDLARRDVPYYRNAYKACDLKHDELHNLEFVRHLPILTKDAIKANFPDRIVSDRTSRESLYPIATSGTTDRVMLFHDEYKRDWDRAADMLLRIHMHAFVFGGRQIVIPADACYERCGADEHGRLSTVRSKMRDFVRAGRGHYATAARQVISQIMRDYVWRETMLKAFGVDGTATPPEVMDEYIESIRTVRPDLLHALPQYAHGLAMHVDAKGMDLQIRMIRPSGGKFTDEMIRTVETAFSARVRENYGTAELGTVSFDCQTNRCQHLISELFFVEFVRDGRHVAPGELGELLITDLRNRAAPLIRYAIGDVGRYFDQPCHCGYRGLTFAVDGRLDETIVTPTGQAFSGSQIADFFLSRPEINYVKVVQRSGDSFLAEVVPANGHDLLADSSELGEEFSRFLGYRVNLRLRAVRRLAPERNGKYKLVDSCSYKRFNGATTNG